MEAFLRFPSLILLLQRAFFNYLLRQTQSKFAFALKLIKAAACRALKWRRTHTHTAKLGINWMYLCACIYDKTWSTLARSRPSGRKVNAKNALKVLTCTLLIWPSSDSVCLCVCVCVGGWAPLTFNGFTLAVAKSLRQFGYHVGAFASFAFGQAYAAVYYQEPLGINYPIENCD